MGTLTDQYVSGVQAALEYLNLSPESGRVELDIIVDALGLYRGSSEAEAGKLFRGIAALKRQHESEQAQLRANLEAEIARCRADLVRSESEKSALQAELDDTKYENGELMIENAVLRRKLGADPLQRSN